MGIPTYTTEKPSNSPTVPPPVPPSSHAFSTTTPETTHHHHHPTISSSGSSTTSRILPLASSTTAPAETTMNPAVARSGGPITGHGTHILAARPADEGRLTDEEAERLYEERMEEEYAKREGGA